MPVAFASPAEVSPVPAAAFEALIWVRLDASAPGLVAKVRAARSAARESPRALAVGAATSEVCADAEVVAPVLGVDADFETACSTAVTVKSKAVGAAAVVGLEVVAESAGAELSAVGAATFPLPRTDGAAAVAGLRALAPLPAAV